MFIAKDDIKKESNKVTLGDPADYPNWKSAREINAQTKPERPGASEPGEKVNTSSEVPVEYEDFRRYRYEMEED